MISGRMRGVVLAVMFVTACRNNPASTEKWQQALAEFAQLKDRACACKDRACIDQLDPEVKAWREVKQAELGGPPPAAINDRAQQLERELRVCRHKVMQNLDADIAKVADLRDAMCACRDAACAREVSDQMTRWSSAQAHHDLEVEPTPEQSKKLADASAQMTECMTRVMSAGSGS